MLHFRNAFVVGTILMTGALFAQNLDLATLPSSAGSIYSGGDPGSSNKQIISNAGDFNGDGFDDFIVSAVGSNQCFLVYGKAGQPGNSYNYSELLTNNANGFSITNSARTTTGYSVSSAGDFNNDGYDDLLIGSFLNFAWVIFGKQTGMTNIDLKTYPVSNSTGFGINGANIGDSAGMAVAGIGDVNNDGYDDIALGAPQFKSSNTINGYDNGKVYVLFGKATGIATVNLSNFTPSDTQGFSISYDGNSGRLGKSIAPAGDFNNDGYADFLINHSNEPPVLVLGKASGYGEINLSTSPLPSEIIKLNSIDAGYIGSNEDFPFDGRGDFNGDGFSDMIISAANGRTSGPVNCGAIYIILGRTSINSPYAMANANIAGAEGFHVDGLPGEKFGSRVMFTGDVNNDGYDDILVSANNADPMGRTNVGSIYLIYGRPAITQHLDLATNFNYGLDGYRLDMPVDTVLWPFISSAEDFNNDSYDDFLISRLWDNPESSGPLIGQTFLVYGKPAGASVADWQLWN